MTRDEFRKVFDNLEYTKEFTESMEEKLSTSPSVQLDDGYTEAVSGVEVRRQSRIVHIVGTAAACLTLVGSCVGVGFAMKGYFKSDDDVLSSVNDNTSENASTVTATVPTFDMLIDSRLPYADLSGKSREELHEIGMKYFEAACELHLMNGGASIALDCDYTNTIDNGTDMNYYLVQYDNISSISDAEELYYSIFSQSWEFEEGFFLEQDGSLYYSCDNNAYNNACYEGWDINFVEATDEKIKYQVNAYFNDGEAGSNVQSYPAQFTLIPENGEWKVQNFIYPTVIPTEGEEPEPLDEETAAQLRKFLTEADRNCYLITSPYVDFDQYYDTINGKTSMEELEEQGLAFFGCDINDGWYYRVTNGKSEQELLDEHHSYFTEEYYDNFDDIVTERDGVAYVASPPAHYYPFHDFEASADEITIKSKSDTEVVIEVAVDCTEAVVDYYQYNIVNSPLPEGYKYTYPQEIVLVNTEDGWRISDYIPYSDFRRISLYDCPEMQEYIDSEGGIIYNPLIVDNPEEFIGLWRVDGDEYGYELNVISADDIKVVFELSSYRSFGTSPITAEHLSGYGYFNTLGDDDNINIEGNLNLNTDGTIYLEITSSESSMVTVGTCITFNTKVQ